jgi:hypothetical protein
MVLLFAWFLLGEHVAPADLISIFPVALGIEVEVVYEVLLDHRGAALRQFLVEGVATHGAPLFRSTPHRRRCRGVMRAVMRLPQRR